MAGRSIAWAWVAGAMVALSACTLANHIDVCERAGGDEVQTNVRTDGHQQLWGHGSLVPIAGGGAFIAYTGSPSGQSETHRDIRGGFLTQDGSPLRTCDADGEGELTYVALDQSERAVRFLPVVGTSSRDLGTGFLVWAEGTDPLVDAQIYGLAFAESTGCLLDDAEASVPFPISESGPDWVAISPSIVPMGTTSAGSDRYVMVWHEYRLIGVAGREERARARTLVGGGFGYEWDMNIDDPFGGPIDLRGLEDPSAVRAARVDDERFAVVAYRTNVSTVEVTLHLYDRALRDLAVYTLRPRVEMAGAVPPTLALASDGEHIMVAWVERSAEGAQRVVGVLVDPDTGVIAAPAGAGTEPFRLGSTEVGDEQYPTVAAMPGGGFVAAWHEQNAVGHEDADGSGIRAAAFTHDGARRFVNPACDAADFQLNQSYAGQQGRPALAALPDGSLVAAWNDDGARVDLSEGGIRSRVLEPHDLFPLP